MHSSATDRRSASKCQGKCPDQTLDQAFGLSEVLVAVSTLRLPCKRVGKTRTLMPVWDSSGESRSKNKSTSVCGTTIGQGKMNTSTPTGAAIPGTLVARSVIAQPSPGPRAAVVIGINKTGNLPVLSAAASGAREVARWLQGEGFEVNQFIDDDGKPIELAPIFKAVKDLVDRGTLEQLVVYFSGHGFMPSV